MGEILLSAKELLFAAAKLGANCFAGIADPFYGMTDEEIRLEREELQLSLEKKGYAEVGFDDVFTLKPEAADLVSVCAECESYLLMQLLPPGEKAWQLLVYAGKGGLVTAQVRGQEVTLDRIGKETVTEKILAQMAPVDAACEAEDGTKSDAKGCIGSSTVENSGTENITMAGSDSKSTVAVSRSDLAEAQSQAIEEPEKAALLLRGKGCPAETAALLVQGFRGEIGRYMLFHTDIKTRALTELTVLQGAAGAVCMRLEDIDEEIWRADFLPGGVTENTLREWGLPEKLCPENTDTGKEE